jgi:SAM-dependent methyltransferase
MGSVAERTRFFDQHWRAIVKTRTTGIDEYLEAERRQLDAWLADGTVRLVVEAGCADGELLLPVVLRRPELAYLGVDLAAEAIAALRRCFNGLRGAPYLGAVQGDIADLPRLTAGLPLPATGWLTALPFNVIGELSDPRRALAAARRCGSDLAIFTYDTGAEARRVREEYYRACGFDGRWEAGPTYRSDDGFFSAAYPRRLLHTWLTDLGYRVDPPVPLTGFALAVRARLPHSPTRR